MEDDEEFDDALTMAPLKRRRVATAKLGVEEESSIIAPKVGRANDPHNPNNLTDPVNATAKLGAEEETTLTAPKVNHTALTQATITPLKQH
jgi:hypothetical protein